MKGAVRVIGAVLILVVLSAVIADQSAVQQIVDANNVFASSTYREVAAQAKGNILVSPISAEIILALAQSGSKGETAREIRNALNLPNDNSRIQSGVQNLLQKLKNKDLYSLTTANKVYVKENFSLKDNFKRTATEVYASDSENIDFTKRVDAANSINSWVEKHTENKIHNLISSSDLNNLTRLVLINALYFQANWSNPFKLVDTVNISFFKTAEDVVQVNALQHFEEHFNYYECPHLNAQFVELPFKGGEASLFVVLPKEKEGLANLESQIETVFTPPHELTQQYLNVILPKFRIESDIDFKGVLKKLGVEKAFNDSTADLSGIAGKKGDLVIDKVLQKTFIDVSEEGVEAAAATLVLIPGPISARLKTPKEFRADHPFIFYIKIKGIIAFVGRYLGPTIS